MNIAGACRIASFCALVSVTALSAETTVFVEAESFQNVGGWVTDQQAMDTMGSPYLMAHDLGHPVQDATTSAAFPRAGVYRIWVRTRDWVAPWKNHDTPDVHEGRWHARPITTHRNARNAAADLTE